MSFGKRGLPSEPVAEQQQEEPIRQPKNVRWRPSDYGIDLSLKQYLQLGIVGLLGMLLVISPKKEHIPRKMTDAELATERCEQQEAWAYITTQDAVSRRLKSPSTASYPWITSIVSRYIGNCRYEVLAYVDAQNSFGATIRNYFHSELKIDPKTGNTSITSLKIE